MIIRSLEDTARELVSNGKGILAADESFPTIGKRFKSTGIESTEETRRTYREMLFTTPGIEQFISGVILFDETIRQLTHDGIPFPELLKSKGIMPGIKVDKHARDLPFFPGEKITEGLDNLRDRLAEYRELGARFTKWRSVINIGKDIPTDYCVDSNARALARFAALSQEAGLVPIVESEVLMDGDHDIDRCEDATEMSLSALFRVLHQARVHLEGILLKPNMVLPGIDSPYQVSVEEAAETTVRCMRRVVPAAVPGIVFLSGGQDAVLATEHLNAMNKLGPQPWTLSFSFSRALQEPVLNEWRGQAGNVSSAQSILYHRAKMNNAANNGKYSDRIELMAA